MKNTARECNITIRQYSLNEEILSAVSHGFGIIISIIGVIILIGYSFVYGDAVRVFASGVFGFSIITLYTSSTLYHAISFTRIKQVFRVFDHCSIFLLIAGSYTPIALITIGGAAGLALCLGIWCTAVIGILLNIFGFQKMLKFSVILYLAMSWVAVFALKAVITNMPLPGVLLLVLGGLIYSVGVIFYKMKKRPYMHGVWHFFVLGGSILHFCCILFYVLPIR